MSTDKFVVLTLTREEVEYLVPDLPEISDRDMHLIAERVADGISETCPFWAILEDAIDHVFGLGGGS